MTQDERDALILKIAAEHREMYAAFMQPRATGEPPFIERLNAVVRTFENSSWAVKWIIRATLTLAALIAAVVTIRSGGVK